MTKQVLALAFILEYDEASGFFPNQFFFFPRYIDEIYS